MEHLGQDVTDKKWLDKSRRPDNRRQGPDNRRQNNHLIKETSYKREKGKKERKERKRQVKRVRRVVHLDLK